MKAKTFLLIGAAALATLSFTFVSNEKAKTALTPSENHIEHNAPIGGFGAEEIVK